ncbi:TetR/AcrR family transcriptional regulator [Microbacterium sp. BK668]|uniref:TetR/AcrR family transcriptional regulator n=1 Tax=Microbacterium sp. BK668 TaxID=2512118 RepID=UPI001060E0DA|nr:TetR/AcrR family transcriptional regulator [Microbacterium sp. BK668]TDN92236.1 TetR family transcriptional regulator [Microbacterium sp. BK668]
MSTSPPRRRDAIEKSAAIERAAVDLVLEHGYDAVTVDMICARAGVSQRTFFNHFRTKDAALVGADAPSLDERAARAFIVSTGPLLLEAAQLIRIDPGAMAADPDLLARRIRAVGTNPVLMARQMDRLAELEHELADIIHLRLRTQHPDEPDEDLVEEAEIITHILAGVMRYIAQSWAKQVERGDAPAIDPSTIGDALQRALRRLA